MKHEANFPPPDPPELLCGPFEVWRVIVDGHAIPRLTGNPMKNGNIVLTVDDRFSAEFPPEHARQAAWLIAQAFAIGAGYAHLGAPDKTRPFAPFCTEI